jgi:uncharacterized membrane protein (DUF441 family)
VSVTAVVVATAALLPAFTVPAVMTQDACSGAVTTLGNWLYWAGARAVLCGVLLAVLITAGVSLLGITTPCFASRLLLGQWFWAAKTWGAALLTVVFALAGALVSAAGVR